MRNKLIIALALVCTLGFGSISIANAQCGGMKMSGHRHARRHARRHGRGHRRHMRMAHANMMGGIANH